jgi:hypothetical protein
MDFHPFHLLSYQASGHGNSANVMAGGGFDGHHITYLKP